MRESAEYYDQVYVEMTGTKKLVPMYRIQRQMRE